MIWTFTLFLLLALRSAATPVELAPRACPTGKLIEPSPGQTYKYTDVVRLLYQRVNTPQCQTISIQTDVEATDQGEESNVVNGLQAGDGNTDEYIEAFFITPSYTCGDQFFLVFETQNTPSGVTQVQSASPTIHINCEGTNGSSSYPSSYPPSTHTGPHGVLLSPKPGLHLEYNNGLGTSLHLQYQRLVTPEATTVAIQASLTQEYGGFYLANAPLESLDYGQAPVIDYFFDPAQSLFLNCGNYNLTINEIQDYKGKLINFQTASVPVVVGCIPT